MIPLGLSSTALAKALAGRVLAVISTERKDGLRIISARKTSRHERGIYEQG